MRALVLGGAGMLGQAVVVEGRRRGATVLGLSRTQADLTDRDRLLSWADSFDPDLVVNCAAFTQVDACEERRQHAMAVNGEAVANVVEMARRCSTDRGGDRGRGRGARLIHISSDYVFDGSATEPYGEDAPTGPLSVYGESKLLGEQRALEYDDALALRASWLFGPGGPNFVATIARLLRAGKPLRVVDDQVGCPTYTPYLARAIWDLAPLELRGILHYRNREAVSWHGFAQEIAHFTNPTVEVRPIPTSEYPRPAHRPAYSVLDVSRFETAVGRRVEPWVAGLAAYLDLA